MASFRASAGIVEVHAGVDPASVLEAARAAVASGWHVEDSFVDVEPLARGTGAPRVTVRFVVPTGNDAEEDASAWQAARLLAAAVGRLATWTDLRVFRRTRGRWDRLEVS
ncbi:MAG: hypothetical protein QM779_06040 [Propionicimonas sp.]|uniref:hypothetical protein n=1 Tax=Propionicimonas sp. TaxID=1955623 RepID=UPI003D0A1651